MTRAGLVGFACVLSFVADRALAWVAVEVNAAGALLSPSGAIDLDAALVALLFVAARLAFIASVAGGAAWVVAGALGRALGVTGAGRGRTSRRG